VSSVPLVVIGKFHLTLFSFKMHRFARKGLMKRLIEQQGMGLRAAQVLARKEAVQELVGWVS
jgi:hypothetical protein